MSVLVRDACSLVTRTVVVSVSSNRRRLLHHFNNLVYQREERITARRQVSGEDDCEIQFRITVYCAGERLTLECPGRGHTFPRRRIILPSQCYSAENADLASPRAPQPPSCIAGTVSVSAIEIGLVFIITIHLHSVAHWRVWPSTPHQALQIQLLTRCGVVATEDLLVIEIGARRHVVRMHVRTARAVAGQTVIMRRHPEKYRLALPLWQHHHTANFVVGSLLKVGSLLAHELVKAPMTTQYCKGCVVENFSLPVRLLVLCRAAVRILTAAASLRRLSARVLAVHLRLSNVFVRYVSRAPCLSDCSCGCHETQDHQPASHYRLDACFQPGTFLFNLTGSLLSSPSLLPLVVPARLCAFVAVVPASLGALARYTPKPPTAAPSCCSNDPIFFSDLPSTPFRCRTLPLTLLEPRV